MNLSYWEIKSWFSNVDFAIVGSGIVGLSTALHLKQRYPQAHVLVLEKGMLPEGASTKNAGFACFGSLSEIMEDLKTHSEEEVLALVQKRWEGLQLLRKILGDSTIDYQQHGGYELFYEKDPLWEECMVNKESINRLLYRYFNDDVYRIKDNIFHFKKIHPRYLFNPFEGQIDTGRMMLALTQKVQQLGVRILTNCRVEGFEDVGLHVAVNIRDFEFQTSKLLLATNGFAKELIHVDIEPARAQVLITKPIKDLAIKGTFHLDKGYFYFRNIDNRILFGGGRNLDFKTEETTEFGITELVQNRLEELLKTTILPEKTVEIDYRWSGIMGVGNQKKPIVKQYSSNVYCGVRLGGMGVAIGSLLGKELSSFA